MEQERFVVIDNKKGILIPLSQEKEEGCDNPMIRRFGITDSLSSEKEREIEKPYSVEVEEKVNKVHLLIKSLIKQTIKDTVKEYNLQLAEELKEYEKYENDRWNELQKREEDKWTEMRRQEQEHWDCFEKRDTEYREKMRKEEEKRWKHMEEHFEIVDKSIRERQMRKKRNG